MDSKAFISEIKESEQYKTFMDESKDAYLAHVFIMMDQDDNLIDKQVGFYNPESKKITSFTNDTGGIKRMQEAEVFRKEKSAVLELDIDAVKADCDEINTETSTFLKDKYQASASRKIFILQHLDVGQVWNITFLTNKLSTVNIKIDAETKEIISDEEVQIMDFNQSG